MHLDAAGLAHPAQVVATQVDEHDVLGTLLLVGTQVLLQEDVLLLGGTAPAGARDGVRGRAAVADRHQRLGTRPDDRERCATGGVLEVQQVHVRAGVGGPQHPVHVERVGRAVHLEPLRHDDLERLAGPDLLLGDLDGRAVVLLAAPAQERGLGRRVHPDRRRRRDGQLGGHPVEAGDGVVVGGVDALVGAVPVDRVGDQRDRALVVVDRGQVGGQQHDQLGQGQVVDRGRVVADALHAAHHVVAHVADHPAGQRRQPRQLLAAQLLDDGAQRGQRVALGGQAHGDLTGPVQPSVDGGERRGTAGPDERPSRPRPAVLRRLQQERAGSRSGELAVDPDGRLVVGEEPAGHRDDPVPRRELAELLAGRGDRDQGRCGGGGRHPAILAGGRRPAESPAPPV